MKKFLLTALVILAFVIPAFAASTTIGLEKSVNIAAIHVGDTFTWYLAVTPSGAVTGLNVWDSIPSGITFIGSSPAATSTSGNVRTWVYATQTDPVGIFIYGRLAVFQVQNVTNTAEAVSVGVAQVTAVIVLGVPTQTSTPTVTTTSTASPTFTVTPTAVLQKVTPSIKSAGTWVKFSSGGLQAVQNATGILAISPGDNGNTSAARYLNIYNSTFQAVYSKAWSVGQKISQQTLPLQLRAVAPADEPPGNQGLVVITPLLTTGKTLFVYTNFTVWILIQQ